MRLRMLTVLTLMAVLTPAPPADSRPEGVAGFPRIVSGDTLRFGHRTVRLNGIKAPEPGTICRAGDVSYRCGDAARQLLSRLIGKYQVSCTGVDSPRIYPAPAVCRLGKYDLNRFMLVRGYAVVDRSSCGQLCLRYERIAAKARTAKRGVWQGEDLPWELQRYRQVELAERDREKPGSAFSGWWH